MKTGKRKLQSSSSRAEVKTKARNGCLIVGSSAPAYAALSKKLDGSSKRKVSSKEQSDSLPAKKAKDTNCHAVSNVLDEKCHPMPKPTPTAPSDISANWKRLQQELGLVSKKQVNIPDRHAVQPEPKQKLWFDNVDKALLEPSIADLAELEHHGGGSAEKKAREKLVKANAYGGVTNAVAMDCEMVGIGYDGKESILARVSVVNQFGQCIYDTFVKPTEKVTDYRTAVSGVRSEDLESGKEFGEVQKAVSDILKGRMLVGHAVYNDLKVLFLDHPRKKIRDTSVYKPFRALFEGRKPSLKKLTAKVLSVQVQDGEHNSIQDAQAAMRLYTSYRLQWEKEIKLAGKARSRPTAPSCPSISATDLPVKDDYTSEFGGKNTESNAAIKRAR